MYFNLISNAQRFFSSSQFIHPALKNIPALRRGLGAELLDMCYQLKAMSLVPLFLSYLYSCSMMNGCGRAEGDGIGKDGEGKKKA